MEQQLKQRLVGAAVLLGLAVLFIPMVLNNTDEPSRDLGKVDIPVRPEVFSSRVVPVNVVETDEAKGTAQNSSGIDEHKLVETLPLEPMAPEVASDAKQTDPENNAPVRQGVTAWVVQLASFASEENARKLEQRLLKKGYAAFVEAIDDSRKTVFRVRIGPELLKSTASKLVERLEKETKLKGIVVRYP